MFLPCPHCGFLVSLAPGDAQGQRCPRCERPLEDAGAVAAADATGTVSPDGDAADARVHPSGETPTSDLEPSPAVHVRDPAPVDPASGPTASRAAATVDPTPAGTVSRRARTRGPSFARITLSGEMDTLRWPLRGVAALLTVLLLVQLLLAQRTELATDARWRPLVEAACGVVGCTVPPWHDPDAFHMLDRNVRPKPGHDGVLEVTASFRNDAPWPQAWPTLEVGLTDVEGREVAARAFTVDEYRGDADADALLAPGQSAAVRFDVREPAAPIVAFSFDFR